jgi:3-methyl-2-oxobutanoate hydroxymethyltransferase
MTTGDNSRKKPLILTDLRRMKAESEPIACLTAYDASFALVEERPGMDVVLVGDSLGMVIHGSASTTAVTVDDVIYHTRYVARGLQRAFLMADMPFLSYTEKGQAQANAARLMQEGGAKMVKLEGGETQAEIVAHLTTHGVPVCGHVGLQPQHVHKLGGFKVQGREEQAAEAMLRDAHALVDAGADMLVVECVPNAVGRRVTEQSSVPVIGIGAGPDTDGQILVLYDILALPEGKKPRFVRPFLSETGTLQGAVTSYVDAVRKREYPAQEHTFG